MGVPWRSLGALGIPGGVPGVPGGFLGGPPRVPVGPLGRWWPSLWVPGGVPERWLGGTWGIPGEVRGDATVRGPAPPGPPRTPGPPGPPPAPPRVRPSGTCGLSQSLCSATLRFPLRFSFRFCFASIRFRFSSLFASLRSRFASLSFLNRTESNLEPHTPTGRRVYDMS